MAVAFVPPPPVILIVAFSYPLPCAKISRPVNASPVIVDEILAPEPLGVIATVAVVYPVPGFVITKPVTLPSSTPGSPNVASTSALVPTPLIVTTT